MVTIQQPIARKDNSCFRPLPAISPPVLRGNWRVFPNKAGGIDWIAVTTARMKGWKTRSFREKSFFHYRHLGTAERSVSRSSVSYGEKDYYLGGHPIWELFRVAFRMSNGRTSSEDWLWDWATVGHFYADYRARFPELMAFHRQEQMRKLKAIFKSALTFKPIDKFQLLSE